MANLLSFEWERSAQGYRWVEFDPSTVHWVLANNDYEIVPPDNSDKAVVDLIEKYGYALAPVVQSEEEQLPYLFLAPIGDEVVSYNPTESGACLFEEFADTPRTTDGILHFANRFGLLGDRLYCETAESWLDRMQPMRKAVNFWKQNRDGDLTKFVHAFNRRKHGLFHDEQRVPVQVRFSEPRARERPRLALVPDTLLSFMWLELALAVEGNQSYRRCLECPTWFEVGTGEGRKDKQYCSDACKMRAYRRRKGGRK